MKGSWRREEWNGKAALTISDPGATAVFPFVGTNVGLFVWMTDGAGNVVKPGMAGCWVDDALGAAVLVNAYREKGPAGSGWTSIQKGLEYGNQWVFPFACKKPLADSICALQHPLVRSFRGFIDERSRLPNPRCRIAVVSLYRAVSVSRTHVVIIIPANGRFARPTATRLDLPGVSTQRFHWACVEAVDVNPRSISGPLTRTAEEQDCGSSRHGAPQDPTPSDGPLLWRRGMRLNTLLYRVHGSAAMHLGLKRRGSKVHLGARVTVREEQTLLSRPPPPVKPLPSTLSLTGPVGATQ